MRGRGDRPVLGGAAHKQSKWRRTRCVIIASLAVVLLFGVLLTSLSLQGIQYTASGWPNRGGTEVSRDGGRGRMDRGKEGFIQQQDERDDDEEEERIPTKAELRATLLSYPLHLLCPPDTVAPPKSSPPSSPPVAALKKDLKAVLDAMWTNTSNACRSSSVAHTFATEDAWEMQQRLQTVFHRFDAVDDVHPDPISSTAADGRAAGASPPRPPYKAKVRARFLTPVNDLSYKFLLPFVGSAFVSGIPVELLHSHEDSNTLSPDFAPHTFTLMDKWKLLEGYLNSTSSTNNSRSGAAPPLLEDQDVLVLVDADVLFTGVDPLPILQEYLSRSARGPEELDPVAVRTHQAQPPVLFSVEPGCFHPETMDALRCVEAYKVLEDLYDLWTQRHNVDIAATSAAGGGGSPSPSLWSFTRSENDKSRAFSYLNSGIMVGRVWAVKQLLLGLRRFIAFHPPKRFAPAFYKCDQSILGTLYLESVWAEWTSGSLSDRPQHSTPTRPSSSSSPPPPPHSGSAPTALLPPYGLPAGLIGLDHALDFLLPVNDRDRLYLNGRRLGNGYGFVHSLMRALERHTTGEVGNNSTTERQRRSPTGIMLSETARLAAVPPSSSSQSGGTSAGVAPRREEGVLDISAPAPEARGSLGLHLNGWAKGHAEAYATTLPWKIPLYAELRGWEKRACSEKGEGCATALLLPHHCALVGLFRWAPPLKLWNMTRIGETALTGTGVFFLDGGFLVTDDDKSKEPFGVSFETVCRRHDLRELQDQTWAEVSEWEAEKKRKAEEERQARAQERRAKQNKSRGS